MNPIEKHERTVEGRHVNFFVYGTLKSEECRSHCWPHRPESVSTVLVRGSLYDLDEYPALVLDSEEWVRGELWSIRSEFIVETLRVLDAIEGFTELGDRTNLYDRVVVPWYHSVDNPEGGHAYTYVYARPETLPVSQRIQLDGKVAYWPPELRP